MDYEIIEGAKYSPLRLKEKLNMTTICNFVIALLFVSFSSMIADEQLQTEAYAISSSVKQYMPTVTTGLKIFSVGMSFWWGLVTVSAFKEKVGFQRAKYSFVMMLEYIAIAILVIVF